LPQKLCFQASNFPNLLTTIEPKERKKKEEHETERQNTKIKDKK
jgi:hypothetical protein